MDRSVQVSVYLSLHSMSVQDWFLLSAQPALVVPNLSLSCTIYSSVFSTLIGREMLLRQLSYAIKNQLVASKAPY